MENMQEVKIEFVNKDEDSILPIRKRESDAAFDIYSIEKMYVAPDEVKTFGLGIKMQLPKGYCALILERSGHASKMGLLSFGNLIDSNYRGEIHLTIKNLGYNTIKFESGERICQMLIIKHFEGNLIESNVEENIERGTKGLGSSGNK